MRLGWPILVCCLAAGDKAFGDDSSLAVLVGPGTLRPLFPPSPSATDIFVPAFWLDRRPVTNADFQSFVARSRTWRRGSVSQLYVDQAYLAHWATPDELGAAAAPDQPVVNVSWFAARAYCAARGARLATEDEWELAAQASPSAPDGKNDVGWRKTVVDWYGKPSPARLPAVGQGSPNYWGIWDLHGLVWEWVRDFNGTLLAEDDGRGQKDANSNRFCGGARVASDSLDYPSYMRVALRSSLEARYTTANLGFRCAHDAVPSGGGK